MAPVSCWMSWRRLPDLPPEGPLRALSRREVVGHPYEALRILLRILQAIFEASSKAQELALSCPGHRRHVSSILMETYARASIQHLHHPLRLGRNWAITSATLVPFVRQLAIGHTLRCNISSTIQLPRKECRLRAPTPIRRQHLLLP